MIKRQVIEIDQFSFETNERIHLIFLRAASWWERGERSAAGNQPLYSSTLRVLESLEEDAFGFRLSKNLNCSKQLEFKVLWVSSRRLQAIWSFSKEHAGFIWSLKLLS